MARPPPTSHMLLRALSPALLLGLILGNGGGMLAGWRGPLNFNENRELAGSPVWEGSLPGLLRAIDDYIKDNFPMRSPLLLGYNSLLYHGFHSANNAAVILGDDGWVFGADYDSRDGEIESPRLSPEYIRRLQICMEERADWLHEQGSVFQYMFYPTKTVAYGPKHLPNFVVVDQDFISATKQFASQLGERSRLNHVELEVPLRAAAAEREDIYYKTDTHATHQGAFIAIEQMIAQLQKEFPDLRIPSYPAYRKVPDELYPTAYGRLMGVPFREYSLVNVPEGGFQARIHTTPEKWTELQPEGVDSLYLRNAALEGSRVLMIGDSFSDRMVSYLGELFGETLALSLNRAPATPEGKFPTDLIQSFAPDLMVMVYVESRMEDNGRLLGIDTIPLINPPEVRQSRLRRTWRESGEEEHEAGLKPFITNQSVAFEVEPPPSDRSNQLLMLQVNYRGQSPIQLTVDSLAEGLRGELDVLELNEKHGRGYIFLPADPSGTLSALRTNLPVVLPEDIVVVAKWVSVQTE